MIRITCRVVALCAVSFVMGGIVSAQLPPKPSAKKGVITGTVTIKGKPAPEIVVGLIASKAGTLAYKAKTDREGKYRITDLTPGVYNVTAAAPAYVLSNRERSNGESLVVIGGETIEGVNFDLVRGGAISGKVVDGEGKPVIEQPVYLLSAASPQDQQPRSDTTVPVQTDDRGQFRMFGIAAGRYKVGAGPDDERVFRPALWQAYKQGFYPDHADSANATVLDISEGSDISNINIALHTVQSFSVSGRVIDRETGHPVNGVRFGLRPISADQRSNFSVASTPSNNEGDFTIENVLPGNYGMSLLPPRGSDLRADMGPVEITTQDVTGLVIKTWKGGATVSGVVVIENTEDKAVWSRLLQLRLAGFIQQAGPPNMWNPATINADGSFAFSGLDSGTFVVGLSSSYRSSSEGFRVLRMERDGVATRSIEVKNGERISDVRVVLSYGNSTVYGIVKFDNVSLPSGTSSRVRLWKEGIELYPRENDARGNFIIEGIPSGTYELEVSVNIPGIRRNVPPAKQQLIISAGATTNVVINVENPEPRPAP
ncbi:MAG: carboxypeptidase-like regulatory domain-containing protein [bacterium]